MQVQGVVSLLAWLPVAGLALMLLKLELELGRAPRLKPLASLAEPASPPPLHLRVVIPAYNEADNITDCISAALASRHPGVPWQLVVIDDASTDATHALSREALGPDTPERLLLQAGPRPEGERWCGKNWAASVAAAAPWPAGDPAQQWLLFLDADVRLRPEALAAALADATAHGSDLFSLAPRLQCSCLAEWLVQPIVATLLGLGFPMERSNDPADPTAFAAGPFMLFRRSAYAAVGGHAAVAGEVVEDLALARLIKGSGLQLRYLLGVDLVDLQMYRSLSALWEGWTKNWFLGLDRDWIKTLGSAAVVLLLFAAPWGVLLAALGLHQPLWLPPAVVGISLLLALRLWSWWRFGTPIRYWWLSWLGALLIAAIVPASIWKTSTGQGWTWRGRQLA
jgi:glycosyltransferase involved in cell wall biosynthesis